MGIFLPKTRHRVTWVRSAFVDLKRLHQEGDPDCAIANSSEIRKGWTESFQLMAANGDDELLIEAYLPGEYDQEWE